MIPKVWNKSHMDFEQLKVSSYLNINIVFRVSTNFLVFHSTYSNFEGKHEFLEFDAKANRVN